MGLPIELADRGRPRPGMIAVERDDQERIYKGVIIIPDSSLKTKPSNATVVAIGKRVSGIAVGDRVLLAIGVSKRVSFGPNEERVIYLLRPGQILLVLDEGEQVERTRTDVWEPYISEADEAAEEGLAEEGRAVATE